jgi:flagellar hook-associated protein 3 FlgL
MISSLRPDAQQFLETLARSERRMGDAQKRISSGRKMSQASDDPDHLATLLTARAHLGIARQIRANIGRVKAEVDVAEQTLRHGVDLFERALTLGAQGANFIQTAETRAVLAEEIGSILEQIAGLTGTAVEGRFIFSGDSDQTAPYTVDLSQASPVSAYQGSDPTRMTQHPNGTTFRVAHTAQQIFDSADASKNVFQTLNQLRTALLANDSPAIQAAVEAFAVPARHLNSELAFYGTAQNKIAEALSFGEHLELGLQDQIAGFEDTDLTEAILELQQGQTQQQAALAAWSRIPRNTLFDFLG